MTVSDRSCTHRNRHHRTGIPTWWPVLPALLLLAGCTPAADQEQATGAAVETAAARIAPIEQTFELTGDVEAANSVRLFGQIPDRLVSVAVEVGETVRAGQVLARIRDEALRAGVDQIEANLRAARVSLANLQDELERSRRLNAAGAVSNQTLESLQTRTQAAQAQVEQLEAALSQAQVATRNALITAPFDGVIAERYVEAGDMAGPGLPIFRLVSTVRVKVTTEVSQERLGQVRLGMAARIRVSAWPGVVFTGEVTNIAPVLDPITRMTALEISVPNREGRLKPGMFAQVTMVVRQSEESLLIPIDGVMNEYRYVAFGADAQRGQDGGLEAEVFVVVDNTVHLRPVRLGIIGRDDVQVLEGLAAGDQVVTIGKYQLVDGAAVRVINGNHSGRTGGAR
jgi:membrane fusion protein (multidrug efflux system)